MGLDPNRSRAEQQAFEVFADAVKFKVCYELLLNAKASR